MLIFRRTISLAFAAAAILPAAAQSDNSIGNDSIVSLIAGVEQAMTQVDTVSPKPATYFGHKLVEYFTQGNKNADKKKFDYRLILGPHYDSTKGLGLGVCGTGVYSWDRNDKNLPKSSMLTYGDFTTKGMIKLGINGTNYLPHKRFKWDYHMEGYTFPMFYYGMGYDMCNKNVNKTYYRRNFIRLEHFFLARITDNFYVGPHVSFDWIGAANVRYDGQQEVFDALAASGNSTEEFLPYDTFEGQPHKNGALSIGATLTYDTRDFTLNAKKGIFLQLDQTVAPACFSNMETFAKTEATFDVYQRLWTGCVLAGDIHGRFLWGDNPRWNFLSELGNNERMRGYYEGRYRDRHLVECQVELRQKIYRRYGMVAWGGLGEVFDKHFKKSAILPTYGIGLRWEFMKDVNIRVDYGFTRCDHKTGGGIVFSMNEAF